MTTWADIVDDALDMYISDLKTRGKARDPEGVRARTLAAYAGVSVGQMSTALQVYRSRQDDGSRYTIGAEGYGRAARWMITSRPGSDTRATQARRTRHAVYLANDNLAKTVRDYVREVEPALRSTERDEVVKIATDNLLGHLRLDVEAAVRMMQAANGGAAA